MNSATSPQGGMPCPTGPMRMTGVTKRPRATGHDHRDSDGEANKTGEWSTALSSYHRSMRKIQRIRPNCTGTGQPDWLANERMEAATVKD